MAIAPQVLVGRARRLRQASFVTQGNVRFEWFIKEVINKIDLTLRQRMSLAVQLLESKVVANIGRPVTKSKGPRGGTVVTNRSKRGEFPKLDTSELQKSIFKDVRKVAGGVEGYVGTNLDYGLILEVRMNRSFLVRTFNEERGKVKQILGRRIKAIK